MPTSGLHICHPPNHIQKGGREGGRKERREVGRERGKIEPERRNEDTNESKSHMILDAVSL